MGTPTGKQWDYLSGPRIFNQPLPPAPGLEILYFQSSFSKANQILSLSLLASFISYVLQALLSLNPGPNNLPIPTIPQPQPSCSHSNHRSSFYSYHTKLCAGSLCLACPSNCSHFGFFFHPIHLPHHSSNATSSRKPPWPPPHSQLHTLSLWLPVLRTYSYDCWINIL